MMKNLIEMIGNIFEFIYDFIFDWEDDPFEEQEFIEKEKQKHAMVKAEKRSFEEIKSEYELIEDIFGEVAADYVINLRKEVDLLVNKHNLTQENVIRVIIPPEKLVPGNLNPYIFEETIEGIYSQYNRDVILKPGKITMMKTQNGQTIANLEVISFTINEQLLASV